MVDSHPKKLFNGSNLNIALITQGIGVFVFLCLSYFRQDITTTLFFMALVCLILLSFGLYKLFDFKYFSWLLLLVSLILGMVYVITVDRGILLLAWLLTALPVVIGLCRYPNNCYLTLGLLLIGALAFVSAESSGQSAHFITISALQFFLIATVVCGISMAANKAVIDHQDKINQLSSANNVLAFQDPLSGLYNRRYMESLLSGKFLNAQQNEFFSIIIADLDNFRSINELYGHNVGDDVISQVGTLLESTLEDTYIIARWDGNAFIVLLPNHEEEASTLIAELLRKKIKRLKLKNQGDTLKLSLSLGTASSVKCSDLNDLLSHAENSLYQAKHMGGNIVIQS